MKIEACDKGSGNKKDITITNDKGRLSAEEIERMIHEAEKYKQEDQITKEKVEAKNDFENMLFQTKSTIEKTEDKLSDDEKELLLKTISDNNTWLENEEHSTEEYHQKKKEFTEMIEPYMKKLY